MLRCTNQFAPIGTEHRNVGLAVAIVISRDRYVPVCAERDGEERGVLAPEDVPGAGARPEDRDVGLAVAGVIGRYRNICADAERLGLD